MCVFHVDVQMFQHHLLTRLVFAPLFFAFAPLSRSVDCICGGLFLGALLYSTDPFDSSFTHTTLRHLFFFFKVTVQVSFALAYGMTSSRFLLSELQVPVRGGCS